MKIINEITLDVVRDNIGSALSAKQNDADTRYIRARLTENRRALEITPDCTAVINALRSDGEACGFLGEICTDGTVSVPIAPWMLKVSGTVKCDVSVFNGEKRLTTMPFFINVEESLYDGDAVEKDESYGLLSSLMKDAKEITLAEEARKLAESQREANEAERTAAESKRATFFPSVSEDGVLSWTNDKGLENPAPVSIKGEKGDTPVRGTDYWTEEDKGEIINAVLTELPRAEEVEL